MHVLGRGESIKQLTGVYGMSQAQAVQALAIADQMGVTAQSCGFKTVTIRARHNGREQYEVDDGVPPEAVGKVPGKRYNRNGKQGEPQSPGKGKAMPRGKQAAQETPAAEENGEVDYTVYADKEITPTMVDFHEWLEDVTGAELDLRSVALGGTLRMEFQKSAFNIERREARQAERQQALAEAQEARTAAKAERAAAKAAKAEKPEKAEKPAAPTKGTTGRRASSANPTGRGRGKANAAAPF